MSRDQRVVWLIEQSHLLPAARFFSACVPDDAAGRARYAEALVVGTQLRGRFGGGEQPKSSAKADVGDPWKADGLKDDERGTTATWLLSIGL